MKKGPFIAVIVFMVCILYTGKNPVLAQDKKLSFGLNVGAGIPAGHYAKSDSSALPLSGFTANEGKLNDTTRYNGFARTGFHFNIYVQYMIVGPVGIKVMVGGSFNSFNISAFNNVYSAIYNQNTGNAGSAAPTFTASGGYYVGQYMIGPCLKFRITDKIKIEGQILAGLLTGGYPVLSAKINNSYAFDGYTTTEVGTETFFTTSSNAFAYNINAGIEYMLTNMIGLHFNVGYTGSSLTFADYANIEDVTVNGGGFFRPEIFGGVDNSPKTMSIGLIQVTIGGSVDL